MRASPPSARAARPRPSRRPPGKSARCRRVMAQAARHAGQRLRPFGDRPVDVRVLERDARRDQAFGGVRRERLGEARRPAERGQINVMRHGTTWRMTPAVHAQPTRCSARSTSATLQACATQPRGVYGGSASKISLIEPTHASLRCASKPSSSCASAGAIVRDAPSARRRRTDRSARPRPCPDDTPRRARADRRSSCGL